MWNQPPKVGLVVTYAPREVGCDTAPEILQRATALLTALPIEVRAFGSPVFDVGTALEAGSALARAGVECVVWLAATWSFDSLALEFLRVCPVPLIAWGTPGIETGSLCGSQQLVEVLTELGMPRSFVHAELADAAAHDSIVQFARASVAVQRLKKTRFGMLGHRTIGMTEVTFHEYDLLEQFGTLVYYRDADWLRTALTQADVRDAETQWAEIKARCGACHVDDACGLDAMRCYLALQEWVRHDRLGGIAVGCYPDLMGVVCLACGLLAEDGIVTACEGDMNSTVLTAAMQLMSGHPIHNTDLLFADHNDNTCTMSHCGNSAISLATSKDAISLEHVRLVDQGVVTLYPGAPGRVTIANLCGRKGTYRLAWYTGEAVPSEMTFPGIPVKVRLDIPVRQFLDETARFGAGHHWMVAYGDLSAALQTFARLTGLRTP